MRNPLGFLLKRGVKEMEQLTETLRIRNDQYADQEKELIRMREERDYWKSEATRLGDFVEAVKNARITLEASTNPHWRKHRANQTEDALKGIIRESTD